MRVALRILSSSTQKPTGRVSQGALSGSTCVLVLGMHRSGTSVVARGLKALGVYLGDDLLDDPVPDNPKGYWEHREILALNERVMAALGSPSTSSRSIAPGSWEGGELDELKARAASLLADLFRGQQLWGFKDPRTTRLFPFWRDVLRGLGPSVSIVLAIRSPLSAATSLAVRNSIPITDAEGLWLAYVLPWLPDIADYPVLVVDYDQLVDAPLRQLRRIANHLEVAIDPTEPEIAQYTSNFVDDGLRHQLQGCTWDDDGQTTLADQIYGELLRLAKSSNAWSRRVSWRRCLELAHGYRAEHHYVRSSS